MERLVIVVVFLCQAVAFASTDATRTGESDWSSGQGRELYVSLMTSSSHRFNSSGADTAVRLALDRINADASILPGYELELAVVRDTKCDGPTSLREFLTQVQLPSPTLIGVIGCGCSVATAPVADIISLYGLPLVSYTPAGVAEDEGTTVGNHFQLYPSERNLALALVAVVKEYGWRQLSILTQNEQPFIQMEQQLVKELSKANITVLSSSHFGTNQDPALVEGVFVRDARVFVINSYEDKAKQLLCSFTSARIVNARYAWLLYGWYSEEWWKSLDGISCSEDELAAVLERALVAQQYPIADTSDGAVRRLTPGEAEELHNTSSSPFVEILAYDSVWTLALALNTTANMINTNDTLDCGPSLVPLEEFSYGNSSTACLIRHSLSNTNFTGLSGRVDFGDNGVRPQIKVRVLQYRNISSKLQLKLFATLRLIQQENITLTYLEGEDVSTVWPSGVPPHDGSPISFMSQYKLVSVIVIYSMAVLAIIITTVCLLFNIIFRNRKVVRLTSPNLNYFILIGCYLLFTTPFTGMPIYSDDLQVVTVTFTIRMYTMCIGYSLVFGTILAKLWRIYFIFHNPFRKAKMQKVSDWRMSLIILGIVSIALVLLIIGTAIPETRPNSHAVPDLENPPQYVNGTLHKFEVPNTLSSAGSIWVVFLFSYLGLLQIASLVLALLNRKITIKVINDSKEIRTIVYITSFAALEMLILYSVVGDFENTSISLHLGHLLASTMVVPLIIFIPKMVMLYNDPKGEKIYEMRDSTTINSPNENVLSSKDKEMPSLEALNLQLNSPSTTPSNSSMSTTLTTPNSGFMLNPRNFQSALGNFPIKEEEDADENNTNSANGTHQEIISAD